MDRPTLARRLAMAGCGFMAVLQTLLQYVLTPSQAPTHLFALFTGLWLFGLAMLTLAPRFGAAGTATWGLLAAWGAARMHGASSLEDGALVGGSLLTAAFAAWYLLERRRG